jgi:hypothetical protein
LRPAEAIEALAGRLPLKGCFTELQFSFAELSIFAINAAMKERDRMKRHIIAAALVSIGFAAAPQAQASE